MKGLGPKVGRGLCGFYMAFMVRGERREGGYERREMLL